MRSRVERFFRYLKERTAVFHHRMSARNHTQGIKNLKPFLNPYTIYTTKQSMLIWTLSAAGNVACLETMTRAAIVKM